jgi:membrane protease YdiL (CAAX protease family)
MTLRTGSAIRLSKLPVSLRAIVSGLIIAMIAANVWLLLLRNLRVPIAAVIEATFLGLYLLWARGDGPPRSTHLARAAAFRRTRLSKSQWLWGIAAAILFPITIHASIVLLFRIVPFPAADFHRGYDLSFIPTLPLKWLAVVISAASAGICEETGFRGYMQRPIEKLHGAPAAILISSIFFTAVHLTKSWALLGIVPIIFGAGILLGLMAWSARSLVPSILGHILMDIGLFAYWWTGIAGTFAQQPISLTGIDPPFLMACAIFVASLLGLLFAISRLRGLPVQAPQFPQPIENFLPS